MKTLIRFGRETAWLLLALLLASCGGGGGSDPLVGVSANTLSVSLSAPTVTAASPATLTAFVRTQSGAAVVGQTVNFSSSIGALTSGTTTASSVSAITDASGNASIVITAGTVAGPGAVIISFTDSSGNQRRVTQGFSTAGDGAGSGTVPGTVTYSLILSLVNSGGIATGTASAPISAANPGTVKTQVLRNGVPQPNQIVTISSALGTVNPSSGSALTDASGIAYVSLRAGLVAGASQLTATFANSEGSANTSINFTTQGDDGAAGGGVTSGSVLTLALRNQTDTATISAVTGAAPGLLKARLTDNSAVPVPLAGKVITFSTDKGAINPASGTALTDSSGYAIVNLTAGTIGGAGTAQATYGSTTSAGVSFSTDGSGAGNSATLTMQGLFTTGGAALPNNTVTTSTSGVVKVLVLDANSLPIPNQLVKFTTTAGVLTPASGSALTNASGVASIAVAAGAVDDVGTITATTNVNGVSLAKNISFTIALDVLDIGNLVTGTFTSGQLLPTATTVQQGSTMSVRADLVNVTAANTLYTTPVVVAFKTSCVGSTVDAAVTSQSGQSTATYKAGAGCATDTITATATLNGLVKTATRLITITPLAANAIDFISALPTTVGIKGSAGVGRSESSTVTFRVKDSSGVAVSGALVNFALSTTVGGISLSSASSTSDGNGDVSVTIQAGTVPTPVRVSAALNASPTVTAVSSSLSVSTGLPTQNAFSVSLESLNPSDIKGGAFDVDGVVVKVTGRGADQFNNPVPDGTTIQFTTELGSIGASCDTTDGACTVNWVSGGDDTVNYDPIRTTRFVGLRRDRYGRSTITATTIGEESFLDANGNNTFDVGESLYKDMAEAFRDDNEDEDRTNDPGNAIVEKIFDFDSSNSFSAADGKYNGILCSAAAKTAGNCQALTNVRSSAFLVVPTTDVQLYFFPAQSAVDDVDYSGADWTTCSPVCGNPKPSQAVLRGVVTTQDPSSPFTISNEQISQIEQSKMGGSVMINVLIADLNGNAPMKGTAVTMSPGSLVAAGSTTCTVRSTIEPTLCSFIVSQWPVPPVGAPLPVTFSVGGGGSRSINVIP